jgi:hypothetical protein
VRVDSLHGRATVRGRRSQEIDDGCLVLGDHESSVEQSECPFGERAAGLTGQNAR